MLRLIVPIVVLVFSVLMVGRVAAAPECRFCLESVALQTQDGQPWTSGKSVTLVIHVAASAAQTLPPGAEAVVMQTDGDRTKCLGVPLKLVQTEPDGGLYAGLFFPFRPAHYDGKLVVGGDVQDISFDVNQMVAGAAPAGELPAAEPIDTSAPVPTLTIATSAAGLAGVIAVAMAFVRRRRATRASVV